MIEIVRHVYPENFNGACLIVGPDGDGLNLIQVSTGDKHSEDYFGKVRIVLNKETALELAQALISAANESEIKI